MKKHCAFYSLLSCMFCISTFSSIHANSTSFHANIHFQDGQASSAYVVKVIAAAEKTYGYEIYQGKKLIIRQENIPGFPGVKGFKRKMDAQKVAQLVTVKLSKGIMPPTIEKAEMQKLQVKF